MYLYHQNYLVLGRVLYNIETNLTHCILNKFGYKVQRQINK